MPFHFRSEEHTSELQSHSHLHPFPTRRSSDLLTGLFILALFYTIYFMRSLLLPLVLALLLSYLLRPFVRAAARLRISPSLSAAIILLSFVGLIGYAVSFQIGRAHV